jgi:uncharacterized protein (TIGR02172 family)
MEARRISLDDFVLSGGGANGESYDSKSNPSVMLKLYHPGKIDQPLSEMMLSRKVFQMGIPTPEPGEYVVTEDGRYGILFHRIPGKVSYSRATGDHPENVQQYAEEFAEMCLQLHATHVDTSQFENVKDRYHRLLAENPFFTADEKDKLGRFIDSVPDTDTAIHGDLQYSNVVFTDSQRYFIDLGDFCYGYPLFDLGMVYLSSNLSEESFIKDTFHMDKATSVRFWQAFAPAYFGHDRFLKDIEEEILPFAGLKTLIIERDTNCPMPQFRVALKGILQ